MWVWSAVLWTCLWAAWAAPRDPPSLEDRLEHAREILSEVPLVDGHNDLAANLRHLSHNQIADFPFDQNLTQFDLCSSSPYCHTDIPRLRAGKVGAQFWSAFVPCSSQYKNAVSQTLEQIDVIQRLVRRFPDDLQFVTTADGILEAHAMGKIGSLIGVEGGHSMDSSLGVLRLFYNEGVRYMTLTHFCNNPWADNSQAENDDELQYDGLSPWGELVVKEMNRLGMMVDISHVAKQTMEDAIDLSLAPVIFSHSDTRFLCNITRNVPDDVLLRLKENGGIVMVNFLPDFLTCSSTATIQDVVAHINHIRDVAGVDHIGLGSDFDGIDKKPEGLEDVSKYPYLFAELLLDPKWTDEDLKKVAGLNLVRVFREVERVRDELFEMGPWEQPIPLEDIADHLDCVNIWA